MWYHDGVKWDMLGARVNGTQTRHWGLSRSTSKGEQRRWRVVAVRGSVGQNKSIIEVNDSDLRYSSLYVGLGHER